MAVTLTSALRLVGEFLSWWGEELAGMLPGWIAEGSANASPAHIVCVDREGLRVLAEPMSGGSDAHADTLVERQSTLTGAEIAAQVTRAAKARGQTTVGLRIPFAYCFSRLTELPTAAAENFSQLLALDMERATPFRVGEVYSAFVIAPHVAARTGKTMVRQLIVKRPLLAEAIAELERAGLRIGRIDCWDETGRAPLKIDFRDAYVGHVTRNNGLLLQITVASLIAILLAVSGAYAALSNLKASLARLNAQAQEFREHAAIQRASKEAAKAVQSTLAALDTLTTSPPTKLDILAELTQALPDSAWVNDLRITTDGVDINGFAKSTVALLPLLEKSPRFMDATSTAAVTFDPREDKERFSLHVRYRPPAATKARVGDSQL